MVLQVEAQFKEIVSTLSCQPEDTGYGPEGEPPQRSEAAPDNESSEGALELGREQARDPLKSEEYWCGYALTCLSESFGRCKSKNKSKSRTA